MLGLMEPSSQPDGAQILDSFLNRIENPRQDGIYKKGVIDIFLFPVTYFLGQGAALLPSKMRCILAASLLVLVHGEQACDGSTQDCGDGDRVASGSSSKSYSSSASDAAAAEKAAKMAAMVRARDMPVTDGDDVASHPFSTSKATHRRLTAVERETFAREGYLVVRGFFQEKSVDLLRGCIERDPLILGDTASKNISVLDASGRDTRLTLWWEFGSDTIGRFSRSASLVQAASELLGGDEPFASHQKVLLKEPRTGGAWEWHQDFGWAHSPCSLPAPSALHRTTLYSSSREPPDLDPQMSVALLT